MKISIKTLTILGWLTLGLFPLNAGDLVVNVTGIKTSDGKIGATLFQDSEAFPMKEGSAQMWTEANEQGVQFRFTGVEPGTYAVSVSHDLNDNLKVDTNFLGIPKESWGVSNNVRPRLRAPKFKEAQFEFKGDQMTLDIEISK
jgi:uncharacterized protein (DUF2141 family)